MSDNISLEELQVVITEPPPPDLSGVKFEPRFDPYIVFYVVGAFGLVLFLLGVRALPRYIKGWISGARGFIKKRKSK